jgi:pimeloyl-ACP methyl ester carboxylesterase
VDIEAAELGMPALVVAGGHDLEWFQQTARHLAERLPRAELVVLDWAGHLPSLERPDEVSRLVGDFLDRSLRPDRRR